METAVVEQWQNESVSQEPANQLREALLADLADFDASAQVEQRQLSERVNAIRRERVKWAEKAMDEVVFRDIARAK